MNGWITNTFITAGLEPDVQGKKRRCLRRTLRSAFAEAPADMKRILTRHSLGVGGQAQDEDCVLHLDIGAPPPFPEPSPLSKGESQAPVLVILDADKQR